ncbi:MAG: glycosyltransferase [Acidobacteria bacterium]|nr:glycosyltransferase [Acidobacteriota bacterium]MBI3658284.1 glycosyltransferase [Acidobacteriota bacterium]
MRCSVRLLKISVVTPSYNQASYLEETICSVLDQGYPNLEYIIIDGGSQDRSVDIIKKYEQRLAYWVSEPDHGEADAVAKGFEKCNGEILCWLCSDDLFKPGVLGIINGIFANDPQLDLVYGDTEYLYPGGSTKIKKRISYDFNIMLYAFNLVPQPSAFFSRQAYQRAGKMDTSLHYAMDYDLFLRMGNEAIETMVIFVFYLVITTPVLATLYDYPLWAGLAFVGKEIQLVIYLMFFATFAARHPHSTMAYMLLGLSGIMAYVGWQIVTCQYTGFYGFIGVPGEGGPSQGGGVCGLTTISLVVVYVYRKSIPELTSPWKSAYVLALTSLSAIGLLLTISRASILSAIGALIALVILIVGRRSADPRLLQKLVRIRGISLILLVILLVGVCVTRLALPETMEILAKRFSDIKISGPYRIEKWKILLDYLSERPLSILWGVGLASPNFVIFGYDIYGLILLVDSQYVRRLFEIGAIGTGLWLLLWWSILKRVTHVDNRSHLELWTRSLAIVALIFMLQLSITHEIFQVSRVSAFFHMLIGTALGMSIGYRRQAAGVYGINQGIGSYFKNSFLVYHLGRSPGAPCFRLDLG